MSFFYCCFLYSSISISDDNQDLVPIPTTSSSVLILDYSLSPHIHALLYSFSHPLLFFLCLSYLLTAHTSFPPVCSQCQWHYSVAHGNGWFEYVMGSYQARQKTRKKESVTGRKKGNETGKLWWTRKGACNTNPDSLFHIAMLCSSAILLQQCKKEYFLSLKVSEANIQTSGKRETERYKIHSKIYS